MVGVVASIVVISLLKTSVMCALTVALAAQDIKTNVHLVLVPTTVMDKHGTLIDGLSAEAIDITAALARRAMSRTEAAGVFDSAASGCGAGIGAMAAT